MRAALISTGLILFFALLACGNKMELNSNSIYNGIRKLAGSLTQIPAIH